MYMCGVDVLAVLLTYEESTTANKQKSWVLKPSGNRIILDEKQTFFLSVTHVS